MHTNPCETGNLKKILTVKINARVMITTNIDVSDGLTNGAMGTVTNVVTDDRTGKMITILVSFESKHVGQEALHMSVYKKYKPKCCTNISNTGNISHTQKSIMSNNRKSVSINHLLGLLQYTYVKG